MLARLRPAQEQHIDEYDINMPWDTASMERWLMSLRLQ